MILRNKHSGEFIVLPGESYEVLNAFIVPLQCLYKKDYELIDFGVNKKEKDNG